MLSRACYISETINNKDGKEPYFQARQQQYTEDTTSIYTVPPYDNETDPYYFELCPSNAECKLLGGDCISCETEGQPTCIYGSTFIANCTVKPYINCTVSRYFLTEF